MKAQRTTTPSLKAVILMSIAGVSFSPAQPVIAPPPQLPTAPAASKASGAAASQSKPLSDIASAFPSGLPLWRRGPISVRPHLRYRFIQANDLRATPLVAVDTTIQEFSPSVLVEAGTHWTLTYTPTWTVYSHRLFGDNFNQSITLAGAMSHGPWHLGLSESYMTADNILIETGSQTHQSTHTSGITIERQLGQRTFVQTDLNRSDRRTNADEGDPQWVTADWLQWSASGWIVYRYSDKLDAAIGLNVGRDEISTAPNMTYSQPQARLTWRPTERISFRVGGGYQRRNVGPHSDGDTMNNPVYSGSIEYQPFKTTTVTVSTTRSVSASYFANRASRSAGWEAGLRQRLMQRLYFTGTVAEQRTTYLAAGLGELLPGLLTGRDDRNRSYSARLSTPFLRRGSIAVFYHNGRHTSNIEGFSFKSDQVGFEVDYRF